MSLAFHVTASTASAAAPMLRATARLQDRRSLNNRLAVASELLAREWTRRLARTRHATARKLGAKQTKFVTDALWRIRSRANSAGASVAFNHPWFARAFGDVEIRPTGGRKYLTIPIHRWGYGKSAADVESEGRPLFFLRTETGLFLAHKADNHKLVVVFQLVTGARQKQEPDRLPSQADFEAVNEAAAREWLRESLT